jgi:signal transduction histidine kinase
MLWVATYNGLNVVDPSGRVLARLYSDDGLSANEFNRFSSLKDSDGKLLFGSIKGISVIEPEIVKRHLQQYRNPNLYPSSITWYDKKENREVTKSIGFDLSQPVQLSAARRYLYLKFNLTGFTLPDKYHYQYQLEGLPGYDDDTWNSLGAQSEIKLAGMPAGNYRIRVRGFDHRGNQAREDLVIPIHASEFFYKRPIFYLLLALFSAVLALAWVLRERAKRRELESIVIQRTSKIRQDKEVIEEQARQLQELDQVKSRFFTNISHEFRTPLTIIGGMAKKVTENPERWMHQGMQSIQRNTGMLLDLVNQILDLRKLEAGKLQTKLVQGDVVPYLNYLAESFQSYAENKDITITAKLSPDALIMDYDPEMWLRVFSNLLSNAVKYTEPGGTVILASELAGKEEFEISIKDTGRGIPPDQLSRIFDLFAPPEDPSLPF